jgi:hypothetical protein
LLLAQNQGEGGGPDPGLGSQGALGY